MRANVIALCLLFAALVILGSSVLQFRLETRALARRTSDLTARVALLQSAVVDLRRDSSGGYLRQSVLSRLTDADAAVAELAGGTRRVTSRMAETEWRARSSGTPDKERRSMSCNGQSAPTRATIRGGTILEIEIDCPTDRDPGVLKVTGQVKGITDTLSPFAIGLFCDDCKNASRSLLPFGNGRFEESVSFLGTENRTSARLLLECPSPAKTLCDVEVTATVSR